ncbi:phage capsid protein [Hungatella hathewayi]|nr:phage capsid protein [Hungatella hathewayi]
MLGFIEKIRQVIRKMLGKEKVKDALGVDVAISDRMGRAIELWAKMYENKPPWLKKNVLSCGLSAAVAAEMSRLVTLELQTEVSGNDFLDTEYQAVIEDIRRYCEYGCAKGGLAFKPYATDGHIEVDTVQADRFFPTGYNSRGEITSAVFVETLNKGKQVYTRLELHEWNGRRYTILNKAFVKSNTDTTENLGREVSIASVQEWADLEPETYIENVEKPLFAYFKVPNANSIDDQSPLGVSVYSRAVSDIREADRQWTRIIWEYEGSELSLDVDNSMFKKNERTGEWDLPEGRERLFRIMDFEDNDEKYKVYSPAIRDESLFNGFNNILRRIEFNCGLAYGTLSNPENVDKTAEEIKASKQRSYSTVSDIQKSLQKALEHLVYSMDVLAQLGGLPGGKKYELSFNWDDSIVIDKEQELLSMQQDATGGFIRKELYVAKKYGVSEEEALKMMPQQTDDRFNIQEE